MLLLPGGHPWQQQLPNSSNSGSSSKRPTTTTIGRRTNDFGMRCTSSSYSWKDVSGEGPGPPIHRIVPLTRLAENSQHPQKRKVEEAEEKRPSRGQ